MLQRERAGHEGVEQLPGALRRQALDLRESPPDDAALLVIARSKNVWGRTRAHVRVEKALGNANGVESGVGGHHAARGDSTQREKQRP